MRRQFRPAAGRPPSGAGRRRRRAVSAAGRWVAACGAALALTTGQGLVGGAVPAGAATPRAVAPAYASSGLPVWDCPQIFRPLAGYFFDGPQGSEIREVDPASGYAYPVTPSGRHFQAVGFNPLDRYFYGTVLGTGQVVRIGNHGSYEHIFDLPFVPVAGDVDPDGHWWIADENGEWAEIDLTPGSGGFGQVMSQGNLGVPQLQTPGDWSYLDSGPRGAGLYGISSVGTATPHLDYFDTAARTFVVLGPVQGLPVDADPQATFTDGTYLYVGSHTDVYRVQLDAGAAPGAVLLNPGNFPPPSDGAQCHEAALGSVHGIVTKHVRRNSPEDQFVFGVTDAYGNELAREITQPGQDVWQTPPVPMRPGDVYYLFDHPENDNFPPDLYDTWADCRDGNGNPLPVEGGPGKWEVRPNAVGEMHCDIFNIGRGFAALEAYKDVQPQVVSHVGEPLTYTFKVVNTGETALRDVRVDDPRFGQIPCNIPGDVLLPWQSAECGPIQTEVTQEDIDRGYIDNTAVVHGIDELHGSVISTEVHAHVDVVVPDPEITLEKTAEPTTVSAVGQEVDYRFHVTNTGGSLLRNLRIDEPYFTGHGPRPQITCGTDELPPGTSTDCTSTYRVTQEDIDAGAVDNAAVAVATNPAGVEGRSEESTAHVTVERVLRIHLEKTADPATVTHAGERVVYHFTVTNQGNTDLHGVAIKDSEFTGKGELGELDCGTWDYVLPAGQSHTCTADYAVAQADIDAGTVRNTAAATGHAPDGSGAATDEDSAVVTADRSAGLSLVKSAQPDTAEDFTVGRHVFYSYEVTNTGNTTVNDLAVTDTAFTGNGPRPAVTCPDEPLPPNESATCRSEYVLTQADIDQGSVSDTASATGTTTAGATTSNDSTVVLEGPPAVPGLSLEKTVTPSSVSAAGQPVEYAFEVTNTGNTQLTGVHIVENQFGGSDGPLEITCPETTLAAQASTTCTASYVVTQEDIDKGAIANTATAAAVEPGGSGITSERDTAELTTTGSASLHMEKHVLAEELEAAGDVVPYAFTVTNTGTTTVDAVRIEETQFSGTGGAPEASCPETPLRPGETVECFAEYTVTAEDVAAGRITNSARALGNRADTAEEVASAGDSAVVSVPASRLELSKTVSPAEAVADETVRYEFHVTNTGGTALHGVQVVETAFTGSGGHPAVRCPQDELGVGQEMTCTADYTVTEQDAAAGHVDNTAHATGVNRAGTEVTSNPDSARVTVTETPQPPPAHSALTLVKKAQVIPQGGGQGGYGAGTAGKGDGGKGDGGNPVARPGDVIRWTLTVTNSGDTTLHGITVDDPTAGAVECPRDTLAPGESMTCTAAPYTVTEQDAEKGCITDTATAHAVDPDGNPVASPEASATVTVKAAQPGKPGKPGKQPGNPGKPSQPGKPGAKGYVAH